MSFPRLLTAALVLAIAVPVTASAQDRRSPDAAEAPVPSMEMSVQRDRTAPDAPIVQEMRTLDRRDGAVAPTPAHETPSASPDTFPWGEAAALGALALALVGLTLVITLRRRVAARA
jgi:hypothetical protein